MQVESTRMYRVRDVAKHFDVSVTTIYRAIESGQLDALKLGSGKGTLRVTGAAVAAYAHACTQATNRSRHNWEGCGMTSPEVIRRSSTGLWV